MNIILLRKRSFFLVLIFFTGNHLNVQGQNKEQTLHELNTLLVNTVMVDFFTPPVAARIYSYPNIAFYECIRQDDPSLPSFSGKLNGLGNIPAVQNGKIDNFIAA